MTNFKAEIRIQPNFNYDIKLLALAVTLINNSQFKREQVKNLKNIL